ncbi:DMT family transporter [Aureimonas flava]|uniref:DMT family transporter n=1 Tax=Aureimonas flava TaxID=2320271 RepID=A0A3A1WKN9_9HYPH|nr:DMT family transporter [Aureimonas flava]RIY01332.1 DMT family transporter [Aureimonas flava]
MAEAHVGRVGSAIALILLSVLLLSGADAAVKAVSADFPLWQIYVVRSLFAVPILAALAAFAAPGRMVRIVRPPVVLRSLLLTGMWIAYYAALPHMDLSIAATALYTTPLFIAALSSWQGREAIARRTLAGIVLGFLGVVVILRPAGTDFSPWALLPILGAVLYAGAAVLTRTRCAQESPIVLALSLHACLLAAGLLGWLVAAAQPPGTANPFLLGWWTPMRGADWGLMVALGCVMVVVALGVAAAYQRAPPAVVGTFDYAYLVFAAAWGFLIFGERLDAVALLGIALIVAAGIFVVSGTE